MKNHHQRLNGTQRMDTVKSEAQQILLASTTDKSLTKHLMEKICERSNLNQAYRRVKANKGTAGIDSMTIDELPNWIAEHKESLIE